AEEPYSEGIIDHLRAVDGAELVALVRELPAGASSARKGSLRSHPDGVDVSAIARSFGGGGHKRAAGFSTDLEMDEITQRIVDAFLPANGDHPGRCRARRGSTRPGWCSSTSRQARRRSRSSHASGAARARRQAT